MPGMCLCGQRKHPYPCLPHCPQRFPGSPGFPWPGSFLTSQAGSGLPILRFSLGHFHPLPLVLFVSAAPLSLPCTTVQAKARLGYKEVVAGFSPLWQQRSVLTFLVTLTVFHLILKELSYSLSKIKSCVYLLPFPPINSSSIYSKPTLREYGAWFRVLR